MRIRAVATAIASIVASAALVLVPAVGHAQSGGFVTPGTGGSGIQPGTGSSNVKCGTDDLFGCGEVNVLTGYRDPRSIASRVIQVVMGFLGIVAVGIILYGGFTWMTAMGNDEKVGEAKKLIGSGIVGLIIIIAAYSIATFVLTNLINISRGTT